MATLTLNANTASPINLVCQRAGKGAPRLVGGVFPSGNGSNRSTVRGQAKVIPVQLTTFIDTATEALIQAAIMNGAQIPCSGDILGNVQTLCTIDNVVSNMVPGSSPQLWDMSFTVNEVNASTILAKYAPGDASTGETFTRSTTAYQLNAAGVYVSKAINTKRDGHFIGGVASLLLEGARTNSCLRSNDLSNATSWTAAGTGTRVLNAAGLDGSANFATTLTDTDAAAIYTVFQTATIANDNAQHAIGVWITKDSTTSRFPAIEFSLINGTTVQRVIHFNTQTGAFTVTATAGTATVRVIDGGLWWIIECVLTNNTSGNTLIRAGVDPAAATVFGTNNVAATGSCVVGNVHFELNSAFISSPIITTTVAVTRGADIYTLPFNYPPQEMSVYAKFVELGTGLLTLARLFGIEGGSGFYLVYGTASGYVVSHFNGVTSAGDRNGSLAAVLGNLTEFDAHLFSDGSTDITEAVNSVAGATSAQSSPIGLATSWGGGTLGLGSSPGGTNHGFAAIQSFKIVSGARTLAELRAA